MMAVGPKVYFVSGWNLYDFSVVLLTNVTVIMTAAGVTGAAMTGLRAITAAGRLARLMQVRKGLQKLFLTLIKSIPSMLNVRCVSLSA